MASFHSPVLFATYNQLISVLLVGFLLRSQVEAQNRSHEVGILSFWSEMTVPHCDCPQISIPGGFLSTWNFSDENACAWEGVRCTNNFTVEELDLSGWQLPGFALGSLAGLEDLRFLDLSSSSLVYPAESFDDSVGLLTGLTHLDLSQSGIQGSIPANISSCTSLRYLSLEQNQLSGEIPGLQSLVNLQVLLLAQNFLTGPFPAGVTGIPSLVEIDLSNNQLNGTIPSFTKFPSVVELKLDTNMFTAFEEPLSSNRNSLERLSVSENQLGGTIPPDITKLLHLQALNMSRNRFVGNIPLNFSQLWNNSLISVDLSQNNLSGNIPADFLQPRGPSIFINASNNLLSGNLPLDGRWFGRYTSLDLSHNQLSGTVPLMLESSDAGYELLWLQNNQLSGDVVDVLVQTASNSSLWGLSDLRLDNNRFTGDLARMIGLWLHVGDFNVISLSNNHLEMSSTESIPDPVGATLRSLQNFDPAIGIQIYLAGNNFSGASLPIECFYNSSHGFIEVLDLSNNSLDGEILAEVFNQTCLPQLQFLNLSNNYVHGPVPQSILTLPKLEVLDVSGNNLSGHLPVIPITSPLYDPRIYANNTGLCGDPLPPCPSNSTQPIVKKTVQWWVFLIIVPVSVISVLGTCIIAAWRWRLYHARHQQDADLIKALMEREVATLMPLRELKKATENFADSAQIGEGGFGAVYVGKLSDGTRVAIKRSKRDGSEKDKEQFLNEVRILSQVNHRFLVKLLGCCMENKIALLVFEFVPNGTLQEHLHGKIGNTSLSWKQRLNIAVQTADALNYLHTGTTSPIYHRDVKSTNILVDEDYSAKVADFGISKLAPIQATHVSTAAVQGTMGYIDPEYYTSFQLTDKSDVFSFGVVLLELISAKPVIDFRRGGEETSLVQFAKLHLEKGDLKPVIDPTLMKIYNDLHDGGRDSILNVGRLAMKCLNMSSKARPSMSEVSKELQSLWVEVNGTFRQLGSFIGNESEAPLYDHIGLSLESFSDYSGGSTIQNDVGTVQMSHFSSH